jgi:hypothetical protein
LVSKFEGKVAFIGPRRERENNNKMDLKKRG